MARHSTSSRSPGAPRLAMALALCCWAASPAPAQDIVLDGGFDGLATGKIYSGPLGAWTVTMLAQPLGINGAGVLDFGPYGTCTYNRISQQLPTQAGDQYRLTFDFGSEFGWGAYARVTVGDLDVYISDPDRRPSPGGPCDTWNSAPGLVNSATFEFTASGDDVLTFEDLSGVNPSGSCSYAAGLLLDNVVVVPNLVRNGDFAGLQTGQIYSGPLGAWSVTMVAQPLGIVGAAKLLNFGPYGTCTGNTVAQQLPTQAGAKYLLTFAYGSERGWGSNAHVTVGDLDVIVTDPDRRPSPAGPCDTWNKAPSLVSSASFEFIAGGNDVLTFVDQSAVNPPGKCSYAAGFCLDDVWVTLLEEAAVDTDGDGLLDIYETGTGVFVSAQDTGTDPNNPDSDGDLIKDGEELTLAGGSGCPDPNVADSDGDGLADGAETGELSTSPCNPDTDGDTVPDNLDPDPLVPGVFNSVMEQLCSDTATTIVVINPDLFDGPNEKASTGRRTSLANRAIDAGSALAAGDLAGAADALESLVKKIDGDPTPPDWMGPSDTQAALLAQVTQMLQLVYAAQAAQ